MKYIGFVTFVTIMRRHGWEYVGDGYINLPEYKTPQLVFKFCRCNCSSGKFMTINELRRRFRFYKCTFWLGRLQYAPEQTSIYAVNHLFRADYNRFEAQIVESILPRLTGRGHRHITYKRMRNNVLRLTFNYVEIGAVTVPVDVWIPLDNPRDFKIRCRNTGNCYDLRGYLTDLFYTILSGVQLV